MSWSVIARVVLRPDRLRWAPTGCVAAQIASVHSELQRDAMCAAVAAAVGGVEVCACGDVPMVLVLQGVPGVKAAGAAQLAPRCCTATESVPVGGSVRPPNVAARFPPGLM